MKFSSLLLSLILASPACAQSPAGFLPGQVLTAAELNAAFQGKTDYPTGSMQLSFYGAKCDGTTPDDAAIASWLAATVAVGKAGYFRGTCLFNTPIVLPAVDGVSIIGDSPQTSVLLYAGANTTSDIISIGTAGTPCCAGYHIGLHFQNWQLKSNTPMAAGAALHLQQIARSALLNWWACTQDCANNFYHGVWFDQIDAVRWCGVNALAKQDVVRVNGQTGGGQADLWLDCGGKISSTPAATNSVGVRVGGQFGGFYCGAVDIIVNNTNVVIDTTLTGTANFQSFFSPLCVMDSSVSTNVRISDTMSLPGSPGIIMFDGTWIATTTSGNCVLIDAGVQYPIHFNGAKIINCHGDGIHNNSSQDHLVVVGGRISDSQGFGVFSVSMTTGINLVATDAVNNAMGPVSTFVAAAQNCPAGLPSSSFTVELGYVTHC